MHFFKREILSSGCSLKDFFINSNIPSFASLHEDVNVVGCLCEIDESDDVRMVDFLTDLYLRLYSFYYVDSEFLFLINVLSVLDLC